MKTMARAATLAAAVHAVFPLAAVAQGTDELDFLLEDAAPAQSAPSPTPAPTPAPAGPDAADASAAPSAPTSSDPAPQTADAEPPLDVIPLPRDEPEPVAAAPRARAIEEIIVTAQRREESAQDVPISITVFDGKQLGNANITNSADLALYTPSLSANTRFGADNATFSIRGFTQELRTTASVATYMAEVVAPRGQSSQTSGDGAGPGAMFDLANVQVLKGPQGTLFGRNTTGGAVLLVPNRPTDEFSGYLELSGGEWSAQRAQGVVNVPFSEGFRTRLAVDLNQRDGHLDNITGIGTDAMGSVDYLSARFSTVWDIGDNAENYTILSYIDSESTGYSSQLYACNGNYLQGGFFLVFAGALHVPACQDQLRRQAAAGQDDFYDVVSTIASPMTDIEEKRLINTLTWHLSETVTLKNILAYAHLHTENGSDIFGTQFRYNTPLLALPAALQPVLGLLGLGGGGLPLDPNPNREFKTGVSVPNPDIPVTSQETYVAELQLQGEAGDGTFIWQGGLYYENSVPDGFSGNNSAGLVSCELSTLEGDPSGFNCYDPLGGAVGGVLVQEYKTEYLNQAVYAQGTWNISDQFSTTLGLRYTWDESEGYGIKTSYRWLLAVPLGSAQEITTPRVKSEAPTGVIEFDYKPFDGMMAYAKYIRGYRQGNVILAADPGADTFEPEKVDTYEIGLKTLFGGPVPGQLNLAAFYNDFTDQQLQLGYISRSALQTTTIVNAGKSRIAGIEGDVAFSLTENLTLALAFSLLETELLEQEDQTARVSEAGGAIAGFSVTPIADVGDELPYAPDQTYIVSLNWRLPVSVNLGEMDLGLTYSAIGEQRSAATSSGPFGMLDAFQTLNVNFGWGRIFGSAMDLVVFGTNVLDEEYVTYTSGTYNLLGFESRMLGTPRMVGARLRYNFGNAD
ncbi:MAG: TonB-dependent receptor [Sinimarinibacterium flocculans]|uniref:TonB-dependent receptor n=1 Tax=Sinimarinibacterium flocculans TaxID=985250 RepID=UPI003C4CF337